MLLTSAHLHAHISEHPDIHLDDREPPEDLVHLVELLCKGLAGGSWRARDLHKQALPSQRIVSMILYIRE